MRALEQDPSGLTTVLQAGSSSLVVTYPDEILYDAAARMLRANVGRLPVVSRNAPSEPIGYLGRSGVMAARLRRLEEESVREPGWVRQRKQK
jgi:CBS domain-containing protein